VLRRGSAIAGMEASPDAAMTKERRGDMRRRRHDAEQRRPLSATAGGRAPHGRKPRRRPSRPPNGPFAKSCETIQVLELAGLDLVNVGAFCLVEDNRGRRLAKGNWGCRLLPEGDLSSF
jgi:hypothetical protein